jgi:coenzyme F420 hydrogenase subunit beta
MIHLKNKEVLNISLDQIDFLKRYACHYCDDYAAEYADISFGGIGAKEGWTTVISRTPLGRAVLADSKGTDIEIFDYKENSDFAGVALAKVIEWSEKKKHHASEKHQELEKKAVRVLG